MDGATSVQVKEARTRLYEVTAKEAKTAYKDVTVAKEIVTIRPAAGLSLAYEVKVLTTSLALTRRPV